MFGKIVLVLGILGVLLGIATLGVSLLLPTLTSNKVSFDESLIGIIAGGVVLVLAFFIAVIGLIIVIVKRKKA